MEMTVHSSTYDWYSRHYIPAGEECPSMPTIGPCNDPRLETIRKCVQRAKSTGEYGTYRAHGVKVEILPGQVIRRLF